MTLEVKWIDAGRAPACPPNPDFPNGVDVIWAESGIANLHCCSVALPYPAKRCGHFSIKCTDCGKTALITTAGRPDDPRSLKMACLIFAVGDRVKARGKTGTITRVFLAAQWKQITYVVLFKGRKRGEVFDADEVEASA